VPSTSVYNLPRNSIEACRAFYAGRKSERGGIKPDELRTMLHLQDDSESLQRVITDEDWTVLR
jgi:hypothetical protein